MPNYVVLDDFRWDGKRVVPVELDLHDCITSLCVVVICGIPSKVNAWHVEALFKLIRRVKIDVKQTGVQVTDVEVREHRWVEPDLHQAPVVDWVYVGCGVLGRVPVERLGFNSGNVDPRVSEEAKVEVILSIGSKLVSKNDVPVSCVHLIIRDLFVVNPDLALLIIQCHPWRHVFDNYLIGVVPDGVFNQRQLNLVNVLKVFINCCIEVEIL